MKISFERTGGFTGIPMAMTIDVDSLPGPDAANLKKLVADADFFNLAENRANKPVPDGFQYAITVDEGDGKQRTIQVSDTSMPDQLRPLVNELSMRARQRRA